MARITLVKGSTSTTKRNLLELLPKYLVYVNTVLILVLLLKVFIL